jgi:probable phosphomutase (TIGR03848 family)
VPTLLLVRHGRTNANASGILAGRTPGVDLDETGRRQADAVATRLSTVALAAVVTSPLERCEQTAEAIAGQQASSVELIRDERLLECDYGSWTGKTLEELGKEDLWQVVQQHPARAVFPDGESLRDLQARAVDAARDHDARIAASSGEDAVWVAVSHGDVIKAITADALGMHLDMFQRVVVNPGSVTVIQYTPRRPMVLRVNDSAGEFAGLRPPTSDADVGGGTGSS